MISKQEIMSQARSLKLAPDIIEKDYVLNWMLAGINNQINLRDTWIFKGETCLKKCFFEDYRFSEDLDFTLNDSKHINAAFLKEEFISISQWIYNQSGIEIPETNINFDIYENPRGPTMDSLSAHIYLQELSAEWNNMLAHQISDLLPVKYYWDRLPEVLDWIYEGKHN